MYIFFIFIHSNNGDNMKNEYFNQRIACLVKNCKYFDQKEQRCNLGSIEVGERNNEAHCNSFEKRN